MALILFALFVSVPFFCCLAALLPWLLWLPGAPRLPPSSTRSSSQRSRSSSPSRLSETQYRNGPLKRAKIYIDEESPTDIVDYAINRAFHSLHDNDDSPLPASEKLWSKSKELVRNSSGEAEWTQALYAVIDDIRPTGLKVVINRDWNEDVKPPVNNPLPMIPHKRNQPGQLLPETLREGTPDPAVPAIPLFKLKNPRPDICIGLSDDSLARALEDLGVPQFFLQDLQLASTLISDPHTTPLELRFPFLIVEAKSGATGGNLYQAQNQAAVSGASALQILQSLADLQAAQRLDEGSRNSNPNPTESAPGLPRAPPPPNIVFSITMEGPIHELWLHFQKPREKTFSMVCLGSWRTTLRDSSRDLVRHLRAVLRWGSGEFREGIINTLRAYNEMLTSA
ncbi:uncharacterized protein BO97DRAFT_473382 [Aspergillus homomorphus CBS 101889]|uniref:DUF7924 domain-containing protein n=1 Tax=Aspergillus homomorphus (strain CBS 101889) TaxID=1450537 RepID=A0A395HND2_ASPHC|nr:hypothetical protein BO97DRAFT_473382 [Aspergillus homomorphus CBS 101889]RAL07784.1 hypothetical protein BO97DRAFT_473382 [Aspergillus homomorphus CBS 101889]